MRAGRLRSGALLGLVLAVALVAAGCGEKSDTGGGGTGTTAGAAPSVDDALAAKVPDAIKSDGKILIGTDASYAPNEFLDTDGKTVIGFDVDLFNAVAAKLGLKTEWQSATFDDDHPGHPVRQVRDRRLVVHHQRRAQAAGQHGQLLQRGHPVGRPRRATRPASSPTTPAARRSPSRPGPSRTPRTCPSATRTARAAGKPAITIDRYQRQDQATAAVVSGKDDAMLADSPVIAYAVKQTNGQLELLGDIYDSAPYGYVIKKDQTEFAQAVADAVKALITDGTYKTILDKWGVGAGAIDNPAVNP